MPRPASHRKDTKCWLRPAPAWAPVSTTWSTPPPAPRIVVDADSVFGAAEMIVKVKEPQLEECARLSAGQMLFTYLHLAADPEQAAR